MGFLELTHGHIMHYEIHGSPTGKPAVVLHGGPGGGMSPALLTHFDLRKWQAVIFDQRGCGKSTPRGLASLKHNTTGDLVEDIEHLRTHLGIKKWFVFGGSWGTTLGLVYAETYPSRVTGLLLRSVCLCKPCESQWFFGGDAKQIFPQEWEKFVSIVKAPYTYKNVIKTYRKLLTDRDYAVRRNAAELWTEWESSVSHLRRQKDTDTPEEKMNVAIIENHYFYHDAWLKPNQIIENAGALANIPITITHGRYDMVCPINASWELIQAVPHAKLVVIPDAGHDTTEPGTRKALKKITNSVVRRRTIRNK